MKRVMLLLLLAFAIIFAEGMWMNNSSPKVNRAAPIAEINVDEVNDAIKEPSTVTLPAKFPTVNYSCEWTLTLNHIACVGVTPVCIGTYPAGETLLWVASAGLTTSANPNYILIYNLNTLTLVDSFLQAPTTTWGYRDMCFYDGYVYAGTEATLHKIDPISYAVVGTYPVTGISGNVIRALTDNNVEDSLWTTNWAVPIYKMSTQGGAVRTVQATNTYSDYGLGYDPHGYVWGSCQNQPNADLVKYSFPNFTVLDYVRLSEMADGELAGGCEMWKDTFLLYLGQCTPNDKVFCLRLYGLGENDIKTASIQTSAELRPYQKTSIQAIIQNVGTTTQSAGIPVKMRITGPGSYLYEDLDQTTTISLVQGDTQRITFTPQWQAPSQLGNYTVKVWTELTGDENLANDTMTYVIDVTNWMLYANLSGSGYYYPSVGGEKATNFIPLEFGVIPPVSVESVYAQFYGGPAGYINKDSIIKIKIYDGDGSTLLYESDTIRVPVTVGARYAIIHGIPTPVNVSGNGYFVSVFCRGDSHPMLLSDQVPLGRSYYGTPGNWTVNTSGEWHIASFVSWTPRANDVGPVAITIPASAVAPGVSITPTAVIQNFGVNDQSTIPVVMEISTGSKALVYTGTGSTSLSAFDTTTVIFSPQWTPGAFGTVYNVKVYTTLPSDELRGNDTIASVASSFTITYTIQSKYTEVAPTIDGDIQTAEWSGTTRYDISDVLGQDGYADLPGSSYLWFKHDNNNLYFAVSMPYATSADNYDQVAFYLDENNDGFWALDSSEGNFWAVNYESPDMDSIRYRAIISIDPFTTWLLGNVPSSAIVATVIGGYMQFEGAIPFGNEKYQITANPMGDTMKLWMFNIDQPQGMRYGWWPQDLADEGNNVFTPSLYGNLILKGPSTEFGWYQSVAMPSFDPTGKKIKEGGALVATNDAVYAFKGFKSKEFKMFDGAAWIEKAEIPFNNVAGKDIKKYPNKGASLCWNGGNAIYAVKGGGTNEFWKYDISANIWTIDTSVPTLKGFKGGSSLTYMDGKVYLLAGNQKVGYNNFFEYDPTAGTWTALTPAPLDPLGKKWADGSALSAMNGVIYALKGKDKANYLLAYTPSGGWAFLETIPQAYDTSMVAKPKKTKVGDGGAMTNDGTYLYAIKGAGKQDFWRYNPGTNSWTGLTPVPLIAPTAKKSVPKTGAALTYLDGRVYCIKGNKLDEFWYYAPGSGSFDRVAPVTYLNTESNETSKLQFSFVANTYSRLIEYTVPVSGNVTLKLYNAAGRVVETIHNGYTNSGSYSTMLPKLANGVYFLKYNDGMNSANAKIIVQ